MENSFVEKHYETAKSFLEALRLTSDEWDWVDSGEPFSPPKWLFRGHDNSKYVLKPRAWRNDPLLVSFRDKRVPRLRYEFKHPGGNIKTVEEFFDYQIDTHLARMERRLGLNQANALTT